MEGVPYNRLCIYKYEIYNDKLTPIRLITTKAQKMFFEGCVIEEGKSDV